MIVIEPAIETKFGRSDLEKGRLTSFLAAAKREAKLSGAVSVLLTGDEQIRILNREFRHKDKATDVLSFPAVEVGGRARLAGDLAISVETAAREAEARGHSLTLELETLLLHGVLHLAGYDHEVDSGEMARKEETLRRKLGLSQGLIARADARGNTSGAKAPSKSEQSAARLKSCPDTKPGPSAVDAGKRALKLRPDTKPGLSAVDESKSALKSRSDTARGLSAAGKGKRALKSRLDTKPGLSAVDKSKSALKLRPDTKPGLSAASGGKDAGALRGSAKRRRKR